MTKIHMGSGSVYLLDWMNVDVASPKTYLASTRPDLVEKYKTTEDKYYERHKNRSIESFRQGPLEQEYVCDSYGHFASIPALDGTVSEILSRQAFEHLSIREAREALDHIEAKLKPGGLLRLDVPDLEKSLENLAETKDLAFYTRHILGPRSTEHGYHLIGYTKKMMITLVEEHGLVFDGEESNVHDYPAFCLRFRKPGPRASWNYLGELLPSFEGRVLEVGPGSNPCPRASVFCDISPHVTQELQKKGYEAYTASLEDLLPFNDKAFDFVFAAHIVEHLTDLEKGLKELERVSKAGCIVVPSCYKDFMFNFEEGDHKWSFLPKADPREPLAAMKMNYLFRSHVSDSNFCRALCRLFRTGPTRHDSEQRLLRRWFYEKEKHLDVVHVWRDSINVRILQ